MIQFTGDKTQDQNVPMPDGDYFLTVTDAEEKKAASGRDMIEMEVTVCVGPYENRHFKHWLTFIEAGSDGHGMTLHALHAFGLKHDGQINVSWEDFKGKTVKAKVGSGEYKGRVNNKILDFYILSDEQMAADGAAAAAEVPAAPEPAAEPTPEPAKPAAPPAAAAKAVFAPKGKKLPWAK